MTSTVRRLAGLGLRGFSSSESVLCYVARERRLWRKDDVFRSEGGVVAEIVTSVVQKMQLVTLRMKLAFQWAMSISLAQSVRTIIQMPAGSPVINVCSSEVDISSSWATLVAQRLTSVASQWEVLRG